MPVFEIKSFSGGLSDYEDRGIKGAFKFGSGLDIRKDKDTLSCEQALVDEGVTEQSASPSKSPSASVSPSASPSPSPSLSPSPSASVSLSMSQSASVSQSPSASKSPSASASPSASKSPSHSVSPSPSPSAGLLTVFAGLIRWFVKCSDGNTYGFDDTGRVYKRNSDGYWSQVYNNGGKAIKGAAEFPASTGKTYLYFATNTELHRKEIPGRADWNDVDDGDWPKTNLETADWHTMAEAGGALMIANGPFLAMVGYDESYTNEALDLIPGNIAKTIVERNGRAITGTVREGDPDRGVNAAIDAEVPLAQVGEDGEIYFANMSDSMPVKSFPGGGKCNPGGVANKVEQVNFFEWEPTALSWIDKQSVGNLALFGVYDAETGKGGIYSFGRVKKNGPFVLNLDFLLDVDEIGAVTVVDGKVMVSYKDGTDYGVKTEDATAKATGTYEGLDLKAPVKKPVNITVWKQAEYLMAPLPSGASVQFWYKLNKTGSFIQAKTADGQSSFSTANAQKAVFRIAADAEIFEPRPVLVPNGNNSPEIHRIRLYFD